MKYIFLLSKEHPELPMAEVEALLGNQKRKGDLAIVETGSIGRIYKRLAFTKFAYRILFECKAADVMRIMHGLKWGNICKGSFSLRIIGKVYNFSERDLATVIWGSLAKPKVDLKDADTEFFLITHGNKSYFTIKEKKEKEDYESRRPNKRPFMHPSSLGPKLARCLVNLTGIKKGRIVDAFCGTGGILIEAGLMGLLPVGHDISTEMLEMSRKNLESLGIRKYCLLNQDACTIRKKIEYLVSDMPYGKNTGKIDIDSLYNNFLSNLRKVLGKKAVIVLPLFSGKVRNYEKVMKSNGFKILNSFECYVHKSLSRMIYVIE